MIERLLEAERALSVGLLDQAERLYQQAWEADPHNSIAVVGLARVALERGDEPAAQALALRALEIDPDNQAARRMVDRLVEVETTRSRAVAEQPPAEPAPEAPRSRRPHIAPPAAIRTSGSGKGRTTPPAPGPTLPKAKPLTTSTSKAPPTPKAPPPTPKPPPPQGQRAKPAKRPAPSAAPAPKDGKAAGKGKRPKEPGLLDRLFGPRR
jgi:tetratricopeptide (TPR) repeat protein